MKKIYYLLFCFIISIYSSAQNCNNAGFENNTTNGWGFASGDVTSTPCNCSFIAMAGFNKVVSNTSTVGAQCVNGLDYYGGFPVVSANGGNYSLLLNDNSAGAKEQTVTQGFVVTPSNSSYTLRFAAVLQDAGHTDTTKPYFFIEIVGYTSGPNILVDLYDTSFTGWQTSAIDPTVHYLPWTEVTLDLSYLMGYTININCVTNDCADGAHFGYAYIDGACDTYHIISTNALCTAADSTVLQGPPGMLSYQWSGPKNSTSKNLSTNLPGDYKLITTSYFNYPPPDTLYYHVAIDSVTSSFVVANVCQNDTAYLIDQSVGSPNNWQWNFGDASSLSNIQNPKHVYSTAGTYTISLIATSACGATDTSYQTIKILPSPVVPVVTPPVFCYTGQNITICDTANVSTNFAYAEFIGPQTGTYGLCVQVSDYTHYWPGTYTLTVVDSNGCSGNALINVVFNPAPTVSFSLQKDTTQAFTWNAFSQYGSNVTSATWYWGDGTSTQALYPSHTYAVAGDYNICVTVFATCGDSVSYCQTDSIYRLAYNNTLSNMVYVNVINSPTGINKILQNNLINIYPNPAQDNFTIETNSSDKQNVFVFDINGKQVLSQSIVGKTVIDASVFNAGVYNISITSNEGITNKRLVILSK